MTKTKPAQRETGIRGLRRSSGRISTGLTLLNLLLSGDRLGGFDLGTVGLVVGDSKTGKSWVLMEMLAHAARNPKFKDFSLIYDDVESGIGYSIGEMFGKAAGSRIRLPYQGKKLAPSKTCQDFYFAAIAEMREAPTIYILDSHDALTDQTSQDAVEETLTKRAAGKDSEEKGTYGTGKAKANSKYMPELVDAAATTGSLVIMICQTRDNIGFDAMFNPKTRSGGKALRFYNSQEVWFSNGPAIKKKARGQDHKVGHELIVKAAKNRTTGMESQIVIPILTGYGADEIGSQLDWLKLYGFLETESEKSDDEYEPPKKKKSASKLKLPKQVGGLEGTRSALIAEIEELGAEEQLSKFTAQCWKELANELKPARKSRWED
jgi:RecA/RadA recombinase